nr:hypothetical protein [Tanacetum cinerariifolium]
MNMGQDRQMLMVKDIGIENHNGNGNVTAAWAKGNGNGNNENYIRCYNYQGLQIAQKEEAWIQLNPEEFDFMVAAGAYDEIEEVNTNCFLKDNLQQASTSGTHIDSALVYDLDGSAE